MNKSNFLAAVLLVILSFTAGLLIDRPKEHSEWDYTLETNQKGYKLYSDGRFVGQMTWNDRNQFDSLIIADNQ